MPIVYKITDANNCTMNGCLWLVGDRKVRSGTKICEAGMLHCYDDPRVAAFMQHSHLAYYDEPYRLWKADAGGFHAEENTIHAYQEMEILEELPFPDVTPLESFIFAVLVAKAFSRTPEFISWCNDILDRKFYIPAYDWEWMSHELKVVELMERPMLKSHAGWSVDATLSNIRKEVRDKVSLGDLADQARAFLRPGDKDWNGVIKDRAYTRIEDRDWSKPK